MEIVCKGKAGTREKREWEKVREREEASLVKRWGNAGRRRPLLIRQKSSCWSNNSFRNGRASKGWLMVDAVGGWNATAFVVQLRYSLIDPLARLLTSWRFSVTSQFLHPFTSSLAVSKSMTFRSLKLFFTSKIFQPEIIIFISRGMFRRNTTEETRKLWNIIDVLKSRVLDVIENLISCHH